MNIESTSLEGCVIIKPSVFGDERGCFFESFNQKKFEDAHRKRYRIRSGQSVLLD